MLLEIADAVVQKLTRIEIEDQCVEQDIRFANEEIEYLYNQILQIEFPKTLLDTFMANWCVTEEFAVQVVLEYAKFLTLACCSQESISPGFWVDQLWHTHL